MLLYAVKLKEFNDVSMWLKIILLAVVASTRSFSLVGLSFRLYPSESRKICNPFEIISVLGYFTRKSQDASVCVRMYHTDFHFKLCFEYIF